MGKKSSTREKIEFLFQLIRTGVPSEPTSSQAIDGAPRMVLNFKANLTKFKDFARGGLGQVFAAFDEELHREIAVKTILPKFAQNPEVFARFKQEMIITGALNHPGIVPIYGLGSLDGKPCYIMRLIDGADLGEVVKKLYQSPISSDDWLIQLRRWLGRFVSACYTIAYAHDRGIIHLDIKPANIMLGKFGETIVIDWGMAQKTGESSQRSVTGDWLPALPDKFRRQKVGGTPVFMSPEQAAGMVDKLSPASDIYSLGATLYFLLTGNLPYSADKKDTLFEKIQNGGFPPPRKVNPNVPIELEAICLKARALSPNDRYATASELADAIDLWLARGSTSVGWSWIRKPGLTIKNGLANFLLIIVGLVGLVFGVIFAGIFSLLHSKNWRIILGLAAFFGILLIISNEVKKNQSLPFNQVANVLEKSAPEKSRHLAYKLTGKGTGEEGDFFFQLDLKRIGQEWKVESFEKTLLKGFEKEK